MSTGLYLHHSNGPCSYPAELQQLVHHCSAGMTSGGSQTSINLVLDRKMAKISSAVVKNVMENGTFIVLYSRSLDSLRDGYEQQQLPRSDGKQLSYSVFCDLMNTWHSSKWREKKELKFLDFRPGRWFCRVKMGRCVGRVICKSGRI